MVQLIKPLIDLFEIVAADHRQALREALRLELVAVIGRARRRSSRDTRRACASVTMRGRRLEARAPGHHCASSRAIMRSLSARRAHLLGGIDAARLLAQLLD